MTSRPTGTSQIITHLAQRLSQDELKKVITELQKMVVEPK